ARRPVLPRALGGGALRPDPRALLRPLCLVGLRAHAPDRDVPALGGHRRAAQAGDRPARRRGAAARAQLRRGGRPLVRPLAQGRRHRHRGRAADPHLGDGRRRVARRARVPLARTEWTTLHLRPGGHLTPEAEGGDAATASFTQAPLTETSEIAGLAYET